MSAPEDAFGFDETADTAREAFGKAVTILNAKAILLEPLQKADYYLRAAQVAALLDIRDALAGDGGGTAPKLLDELESLRKVAEDLYVKTYGPGRGSHG